MKLKALATFAGTYGEAFHRIEALAEVDGRMKAVDLKIDAVREAVLVGKQRPADIYRSSIAVDYDPQGAR
jgi:type III restriction enzyme